MLLDRSGPVSILLGGVETTVPYRRAVGLIAAGRASWIEAPEPEARPVKPKQVRKPRVKPVEAPVPPVLPEREAFPGEPLPPLPESAYGSDSVLLDSDVSTPTTGVEGDLAGNEPPPIDP